MRIPNRASSSHVQPGWPLIFQDEQAVLRADVSRSVATKKVRAGPRTPMKGKAELMREVFEERKRDSAYDGSEYCRQREKEFGRDPPIEKEI